jgi:predicted MFS family arabinose efflux permease
MIAEVAIVCITVLVALWMWLSVPRKELEQTRKVNAEMIARLDAMYRETKALHSLKDEINSMKVSLGWTK